MTEKLYYWAENLEGYRSDNEKDYDQIIEIKRLNFFIGKNNAGKSRFLRNLFLSKKTFYTYNINLMDLSEFQEIIPFIDKECKSQLKRKKYTGDIYNSIRKYILDSKPIPDDEFSKLIEIITFFQKNNYLEAEDFKKHAEKLNFLTNYELDENQTFNNLLNKLIQSFNNFRSSTKFSGIQNRYIPTLRGLRLLSHNNQPIPTPFVTRTFIDYFDNVIKVGMDSQQKEKLFKERLITGENFYENLTKFRNGQEHQWQIIEDYQNALSSYFFNNERVVIIPIHDDNIPHIKIGNEPQFPISQLGDGLQQVIILTYEAFVNKKNIHAFFIEEPELHMHAGMVRQLMNFYLNETNHYYFFTTHSNHLLDMADESDQVIIQKFVKQQKENPKDGFDFKIYRCDRDRDLLASLGVKPSSVYLANCTIWVEGITDRLYITKYMEKYLAELEKTDAEQYKKYRRFMPNYHYTFVEYAGSNLVHWDFSNEFTDHLNDQGMNALLTTSSVLLIADGDIQEKGNRVEQLTESLGEQFYLLPCKETENTLPFEVIIRVAQERFERMNNDTKEGYNFDLISNINSQNYFDHTKYGIGRLLDEAIKIADQNPYKNPFADGAGVGTIKKKLDFCREIIKDFDENPDWQLTPKAKKLCERIFQHIDESNNLKQ
ncbi:AAA family ATPase [Acinetobacter sp. UBA6720]|uniref:AAA family ATPase n=1 Tax=Acinetobacter sp. UBA6720 TaxID=1945953 RepID=UPI0025C29732|nr:AAA family ATPase [Acinetobacter sp. UBA6720]